MKIEILLPYKKSDTDFRSGFTVFYDNKMADGLTYEEMLGLISAITIPDNKPCLSWLKTNKQVRSWKKFLHGLFLRRTT